MGTVATAAGPEPGASEPADQVVPDVGRRARWAAIIIGLVALVPRAATATKFYNLDEYLWMLRSGSFSGALTSGELSDLHALEPLPGTVPGITTVWLGSLARLVWNIGVLLGIVDPGQNFARASSGYAVAQVVVAVATACLIGGLVWLVSRWIGVRVAVLTGAVLATEPMWVSLGAMLHTDELTALFGSTGLVALAWALGIPADMPRAARPRRWAVVGSVLLAASVLTKLNGAAFVLTGVAMLGWAAWRATRPGAGQPGPASTLRPLLNLAGWMFGAFLATVLISYPAVVVDPGTQWGALGDQLDTLGGARRRFFLGRFQPTPPALTYYPLTIAYRVTPWFLVLAPLGVVVAVLRRHTRRVALVVASWTVVPTVTLLRSGLVYERYALVVLGPATLAAALAVHPARAPRRWWRNRTNQVVAVATAGAFVVAVVVAPWGGVTYNPLLARLRDPATVLTVGWGEPVGLAMTVIERDVADRGGSCRGIRIVGAGKAPSPNECQPRHPGTIEDADYVIVPEYNRQRSGHAERDLDDFELLEAVEVRGTPVVEVWRRADP